MHPLRHSRYIAGTNRQRKPNVNADRRIEMTAITPTWIRRVSAGVVLAAAPALIALGTATASHAQTSSTSGFNYSPAPAATQAGQSWNQSSFHQRHAASVQSMYR
jgi:hypothetical protein